MGVTSVVTYTFSIGPIFGSPSSRYNTSVDLGAYEKSKVDRQDAGHDLDRLMVSLSLKSV